jgi:hypothetical protein
MFIVIKHLSCHHSCWLIVSDGHRCFWCWDTWWVAFMERQTTESLKIKIKPTHVTALEHSTQTSICST